MMRRRIRRNDRRASKIDLDAIAVMIVKRIIITRDVNCFLTAVLSLVGFIWVNCILYSCYSIHNTTTKRHVRQRLERSKLSKYIVFRQYQQGQGAGNQIHGLLAALVLGIEFDRIVCISQEETDLLDVFQPILLQAKQDCPTLPSQPYNSSLDLVVLNFETNPPDECRIRAILESKEPIVWYSGNTYPRWPDITYNIFEQYLEPTSQLLAVLPWTEPPKVVVHLRHVDSKRDIRKGLDLGTLRQLGNFLPRDTFLVTNWLSWYDLFHSEFGWRHPPWISVQHSAIKGIKWAERTIPIDNTTIITSKDRNQQLWADWYTIFKATDTVYHTHSDFSLSAIHSSNVNSWTIQGLFPNGSLHFTTEWWRQGSNPPPLVLRTQQTLEGCQGIQN
jgi:hypothetical protein